MKNKNYLVKLFIIYLIGNFFLLLNFGVFWDDWALYNASPIALKQQFEGNGNPLIGMLHQFLLSFDNPPIIYHILTFILQLSTVFLLYYSLLLLKIQQKIAFLITLLFLSLPYFACKNTMICFPFTVGNFLYFSGYYFLIKNYYTEKKLFRILALTLFFSSFLINSFVFYYLLALFTIFYLNSDLSIEDVKLNKIFWIKIFTKKSIFKNLDYLILPVVFVIVKFTFFRTSGLYKQAGYNEISVGNIIKLPYKLLLSIKESFIGLLYSVFKNAFNSPLLFIIILLLIYLVLKNINFEKIFIDKKILYLTGIIGIILFILGATPYSLVGKIPSFQAYNTRHQLLLPLGTALILITLIFHFFQKKHINYIIIIIITLFISFSVKQNFQFITGWLKQESIGEHIKENQTIENSTTFILFDKSKKLNPTSRDYAFYNLNGIAKKVLNKENNFLCQYDEYMKNSNIWKKLIQEKVKFNMKDYNFGTPEYIIKIDNGNYKLNFINSIKLIYYRLFQSEKFSRNIKNILTMEIIPYDKKEVDFYLKDN